MAKLILSLDGMVIREYPLTKERTTLGRKPHNDIVIDNLAISGEHAMIMTILNDSFLEDLGSTNGTIVNGQPIKKHFLQNNDVIELGKYKLKYINEAPADQAKAADFEKTMVLQQGAVKPQAPAAAAAPAPAPAATAGPAQAAAPAQRLGDTEGNPAGAPQGAAQPAAEQAGQAPGALQLLSGANARKELELT